MALVVITSATIVSSIPMINTGKVAPVLICTSIPDEGVILSLPDNFTAGGGVSGTQWVESWFDL
jgi:hypothetical protein